MDPTNVYYIADQKRVKSKNDETKKCYSNIIGKFKIIVEKLLFSMSKGSNIATTKQSVRIHGKTLQCIIHVYFERNR